MGRKVGFLLLLACLAVAGGLFWFYPEQVQHVGRDLLSSGQELVLGEESKPAELPPQGGAAPPPPEVPVAEVVVRTVAPSAEYTGHVAAVETVEIRPRVGGYIQAVNVPEGELVEEGHVLFQIDPRPFQAALDQAKARLAQAEARLAQAEAEFSRTEPLMQKGYATRKAYDEAEANRRQGQAEVQAASAAVAAAELDFSFTQVEAPIAGRVDRVLTTQGNLVTGGDAGAATLLTTIVSIEPVYVYFDIDEATYLEFVSRTRPDGAHDPAARLPVRVALVSDQGFPHEGWLDFLANRVDPGTGTIRARAALPNAQHRLAPGLFARVKLVTDEPRPTILIDDQAVGTDQGRRYVLVLGEGDTAEYRPVRLGPVIDGLRAISEGLEAGETIILKGLVGPGMQVTPRRVGMDGAEAEPDASSQISESRSRASDPAASGEAPERVAAGGERP